MIQLAQRNLSQKFCLKAIEKGLPPGGRKEGHEGMSHMGIPPDEVFILTEMTMNKRRKRIVESNLHRRPYYGTKQDKELKDAKNRARADGCGDD